MGINQVWKYPSFAIRARQANVLFGPAPALLTKPPLKTGFPGRECFGAVQQIFCGMPGRINM